MKTKLWSNKNPLLRTYYHQWLTTAGAAVIMMEVGFYSGWASPYLARLTAANSPLPFIPSEPSWIASLSDSGRFVGILIGAALANFYGSKSTITVSILPFAGCWICILFPTNPIWLYFGKFLGGVGIGIISNCMSLFGVEIALPQIRGAIATAVNVVGFSIGILVSSIFGPYLSARLSAIIYLVPCILMLIVFVWLPKTSLWLVYSNGDEEAKRSIMWYQPIHDPEIELSVVKKLVCPSTFKEKIQKCIKRGPVRRAVIHMVILYALANLTEISSVTFYMETILIRSKLTIIKPSNLVIYVQVSCFVASVLSTCLIDRCDRKFLLSVSSGGIAISQFILAISYYLVKENVDIKNLEWLPVLALFMFTDFYFIGVLSIPSTILSELFPSDLNTVVSCVAILSGVASSFVMGKSFQPMIDLVGECYVFLIQAALAFSMIPYVYFCLPETNGKSLQQIQEEMMQHK